MIFFLRHIGIRMWMALLFAIPATLLLMPALFDLTSGLPLAIVFLAVFALFFVVIGIVLDTIGRKLISGLVKEAQAWERAGIYKKSRERYEKALRIYDSFLVSPVNARKEAGRLSGAIARFMLTSPVDSPPSFGKCAARFLKMFPRDEDIAFLWLKRLYTYDTIDAGDRDIINLLAEHHHNNPRIFPVLTGLFLSLGQNDYAARKVYQQAMEKYGPESRIVRQIKELTGEEQVGEQMPEAPHPPAFAAGKKKGEGIGVRIKRGGGAAARSFVYAGRKGWALLVYLIFSIVSGTEKLYRYIRQRKQVRRYIKIGFISLVSLVFVIVVINTVSHLVSFKTPKAGKERGTLKVPVEEKQPFTIQVAAYLKETHAKKYVSELRKKGLDASYKKAAGGGKTWFLVRVSQFPDKESAAAYGRKLKRGGTIDDFFVANN